MSVQFGLMLEFRVEFVSYSCSDSHSQLLRTHGGVRIQVHFVSCSSSDSRSFNFLGSSSDSLSFPICAGSYYKIHFQIVLLTCKCLYGLAPQYLVDLIWLILLLSLPSQDIILGPGMQFCWCISQCVVPAHTF